MAGGPSAYPITGSGWVSLLVAQWYDDMSDDSISNPYSITQTYGNVGMYVPFSLPSGATVTKIRGAGTIDITSMPAGTEGGFYLDDGIYQPLSTGVNSVTLPETVVSWHDDVDQRVYFETSNDESSDVVATFNVTQLDAWIEGGDGGGGDGGDGGGDPPDAFWTDYVGCTETGGAAETYAYDFPDYRYTPGDFGWDEVTITAGSPYIPSPTSETGQTFNYDTSASGPINTFKAWGYGGGNQAGVTLASGHISTASAMPITSAVSNPWAIVNYQLPDAPPIGYPEASAAGVRLSGWFAVTSDAVADVQYELGDDVYVAANKTGGHNTVDSILPASWNGDTYDLNTYLRVLSGDIATTSIEIDLAVQLVMEAKPKYVAKFTNVMKDGVPYADLLVLPTYDSDSALPETITPNGRFIVDYTGDAATFTGDLVDADDNPLGRARWVNTYTPH